MLKTKEIVNIACVCSEKYAPYLGTMLVSLLEKFDINKQLKIYILTEDFSINSQKKLEHLKKIHDFEIEYIYINKSNLDFLTSDIKCPVHVAPIAASRILLPKLLNNIDKIVTLECDMLINDDISKLYQTDIADYAMAAVEDFSNERHSKDLWGEKSDYYNTGVCILNLKKLREINYLEIIKNKINKNGSRYQLQEQDIWNDALKNNIKRLDIRWNFYHSDPSEATRIKENFIPKSEEEFKAACENPGIYHFLSEYKCWFPTVKKKYIPLYRKYEKKSPFYKIIKFHDYTLNNVHFKLLTFNSKIVYSNTTKNGEKMIKLFGIPLLHKTNTPKTKKINILKNIFSVKNSPDKKHKIFTVLGFKLKFKHKRKNKPSKIDILENRLNRLEKVTLYAINRNLIQEFNDLKRQNVEFRKRLGMKQNIKIFCTYHYLDDYPIFKSDIYEPIQTGASSMDYDYGFLKDNTGDNISDKNEFYAELTASYWVWKNYIKEHPEVEYIGTAHHYNHLNFSDIEILQRQGFSKKSTKEFEEQFNIECNSENVYFSDFDIIMPKKEYYDKYSNFEKNVTLYSQYCMHHPQEQYHMFEDIIREWHPEQAQYLEKLRNMQEFYLGNTFVMKTELFVDYMEWLFPMLFEQEKRANNFVAYKDFISKKKRIPPFISERFINLWLECKKMEKPLRILEKPWQNINKNIPVKSKWGN